MYRLILKNGPFPGKTLTVKQDRLVAGSGTDAHLRVPDTAVGAVHAVFTEDNRGVHIRAVSHDRAIRINGQPTQAHTLAHGDEIGMGQALIRFESLRTEHPASSKRSAQQMEKLALRLVGTILIVEFLLAVGLTFKARPDLLEQASRSFKAKVFPEKPIASTADVTPILTKTPAPTPGETRHPVTEDPEPVYTGSQPAVPAEEAIEQPVSITPIPAPASPTPATEPMAKAEPTAATDPILARARELMQDAEDARLRSDYKTADHIYERIQILAPAYAPAYAARAELMESRGLLTEAGEQWARLMRNSSGSWQRKSILERTRLARMTVAPEDQTSKRIGRRREQIESKNEGAIRITNLNIEQQSPGAGIEEMYLANLRLTLNPNRIWVPADAVVVSFLFFDRDPLSEKLSITKATVPRNVIRLKGIWRKDEEKNLTATCLVPEGYRTAPDPKDPPVSEYGGVLIRVYFEGELVDTSAQPPELAVQVSEWPIPEEVSKR